MHNPALPDDFDPNAPGVHGKLFGLPYSAEDSQIILLPVPWEVTVSYQAGTALGPEAILQASQQVDLSRVEVSEPWNVGVNMLPLSPEIIHQNEHYRKIAHAYIQVLESGDTPSASVAHDINQACEKVKEKVASQCQHWLGKGKIVGVIGGDHSTPLGLIEALAKKNDSFGILQIDAHCDLRIAYEGFEYSHASIMHNVLKLPEVTKIVQLGIRDFCEQEQQAIVQSNGRIVTHFDRDISQRLLDGEKWSAFCEEIANQLPNNVYISFDIDGLDPKLCPNTGTPVPGGFEFNQISLLFQTLVQHKKRIIGFDLCEVAPSTNGDEWDANVGARILRELCNTTAASVNLLSYGT